MAESADERYRYFIDFFFGEMAAPFVNLKESLPILDWYLTALKNHEISSLPGSSGITKSETARRLVKIVLENIQLYEALEHKFRYEVNTLDEATPADLMADVSSEETYREFVSSFFHEVAAPFTNIYGYMQLLETYLAALKQQASSTMALEFEHSSYISITPETAHHMVRSLLRDMGRYYEVQRKLQNERSESDDEIQ